MLSGTTTLEKCNAFAGLLWNQLCMEWGTKRRNILNGQRNCPSHTISHPSKSRQRCNDDQQASAQDAVPSVYL